MVDIQLTGRGTAVIIGVFLIYGAVTDPFFGIASFVFGLLLVAAGVFLG
jgi:hypothetical protein